MSKGLWVAIGLLVVAVAWFVGVNVLYKPAESTNANANVTATDSNTKIMMSLEKFAGFHHDADILLKELTVLKADTQSAIATKDIKLLGLAINNTYRVMDNVDINRVPTIAPFEVCDEALDTLSRYVISAKSYYSDPKKTPIYEVSEKKKVFDTNFAACQSIVNDRSVADLYQAYQ
ncbi:hypothetical protein KPY62_12435 [Psychrobacter sp. TAE2020]|uniref:hypothetical protein n=1 Tax=Psychrobacter sp. TAE2020 TaxID=2846762 RepID=UPI001C121428|nr:hypothetical protein [Psychrobacter sp. TAE2020]MBU5617881.1 hypothetical protein [Psychrobacter sp. TAE2020]